MFQWFTVLCLSACIFLTGFKSHIAAAAKLNHMFSARLLPTGTSQASIAGNIKFGISDNLELGSWLLPIAASLNVGQLNLALKHKMLELENVQTSFVSHVFYIPHNSQSVTYLVPDISGYAGFMTTHQIRDDLDLHWGFYNLFVSIDSSNDLFMTGNAITSVLAADYYLGDYVTLSFSAMPIVYLSGEFVAPEGESMISAFINPLELAESQKTSLTLISATFSISTTNIEIGRITSLGRQYINLYWRF
jgi:hypothetical protein